MIELFDTAKGTTDTPYICGDLIGVGAESAFLQGVSNEGGEPFGFGIQIPLAMSLTDIFGLLNSICWLGIELVSLSFCEVEGEF